LNLDARVKIYTCQKMNQEYPTFAIQEFVFVRLGHEKISQIAT
jgi:hypothetical protein